MKIAKKVIRACAPIWGIGVGYMVVLIALFGSSTAQFFFGLGGVWLIMACAFPVLERRMLSVLRLK
jgi:hypothetical protein